MRSVDSESSSDSAEKKNSDRRSNRFVRDGFGAHDPKNGRFSSIKPFISEKPKGVGSDDIDPFSIGAGVGASPRPIKGMYATPRNIYDIYKQHTKKPDENSSKSEDDEPPCADYDPINPFGSGNDPDPDHFQPHK